MITIITFILVLGVMVLVHEFGHFIVAKKVGVKVESFSIGMGPRLFGIKRGETDYSIKAFFIGGQVKMLGEELGDDVPPEDKGRSYWDQSPLKRAAITAAGPFLNIVLAVLIAPVIYMIGVEVPAYMSQPPVVAGVEPGGPADKAGFKVGDEITAIDEKPCKTWEDAETFFMLNPATTVQVSFKRGADILKAPLAIGRDEKHGQGISGFDPMETTIIDDPGENTPAKAAGLIKGDRIISIAGQPITAFSAMKSVIQSSAPGPFPVEIMRNGQVVSLNIKPQQVDDAGGKRYILGVTPFIQTKMARYGPVRAAKEGFNFVISVLENTTVGLWKTITLKLGFKAMGGPVEIGFIVGSARRAGAAPLLQIIVIISLSLGLINFFPIPALDGGHIMFALMELVSRRKLNRKVVGVMNLVGFWALMSLIFLVTIQDLHRNKEAILRFFGIG